MNRKTFLRNSSMAALALATTPAAHALTTHDPNSSATPRIRLAVLGPGLRGQSHISLLLRRDDIDIIAICDVDDRMLARAKKIIDTSGKKMPQIYTGNPYAWRDLLQQQQLDGVIIATLGMA